ncbi:MAG: carboxypeptidase regulatory-like domain-containing protein [Planctomycetes bacterium]|nr:carboxypeptidase regulatory-like domain-containing protein [Planctomycetota bacterium]
MRPSIDWFRSLCVIVAIGAAGCDGRNRPSVVPVQGRLLIGGKPAAGANVVLHPVDPHVVSRSVGLTDADGSFRLMTYKTGDGAPVGNYVVTLFWCDAANPLDGCTDENLVKHDRLRGAYFDSRKSPLRTIIHAGPNDILIEADAVASSDEQ